MFLQTLLDHWVVVCLVPLAGWILLSGLDDLFIDLAYFLRRHQNFPWPSMTDLTEAPQRRIAILVPLWHEHEVIGQMLCHNLSAIRYGNYDFFVGVYPNDPLTRAVVEQVMSNDARVHLCVCPHDGPTSKGDCLNWTYKAMSEYEVRRGIDFEILVTHDAEDLIHAESLHWINWFMRDHQMVQIPVVPLQTKNREWTHGLYCDEFAEYQFKDIPVRQWLGGFLPSNGVGTGFERSALETLRRRHNGLIFDPDCLTEDYENGFRIHAAGYRQIFVPIRFTAGEPMVTREYFPRRWRAAIRQRSRWVTGIALQGWQRHGWRGSVGQLYWFWRDRKGLIGNLLSPPANLLFLFWAVSTLAAGQLSAEAWHLFRGVPAWLPRLCAVSAAISVLQMGLRVHFSARLYGVWFAAAAPARILWGNWINGAATLQALGQFFMAQRKRRSLAWQKTAHVYPGDLLPISRRPRLGEVLIHLDFITATELEDALRHQPKGERMGDYLVQIRKITSDNLCQALISQSGLVVGR
ncbi:MAG TPA: glycosyl transferase family protein [Bryobacteraceae bacterium]|nr:glycosyl transferase family protein [Bryobacteraceae bacterium]